MTSTLQPDTDFFEPTDYAKLDNHNALLDESEVGVDDLSGDEGEPNSGIRDESQKSSFLSAVLNVINGTIGAGVLGLPYVIRQLGVVLGVSLLVVGAVTLYICSNILQATKNMSRHSNYITIARHCYKSKGYVLLAITLLINNFGACVVFLSIFGTVTQNLLQAFQPACKADNSEAPLYCDRSVILSIGSLLILPFNFVKNIERMEIASFFKITAIVLFTCITSGFCAIRAFQGNLASTISLSPNFDDPVGVLACLTQVFFAYLFIYNQFAIYKSMRGASDTNMRRVAGASMGLTSFIYIVVAMSGYAVFGDKTDNILTNFKKDEIGSIPFAMLNMAFMICSLMTYPIVFFSPRNIIYKNIMDAIQTDKHTLISASQINDRRDSKGTLIYVLLVVLTNLLILVLCIYAPGLNLLFGLIGALSADALVFLFPAMFYLSLNKNKRTGRNGTAILLLIVGVFLGGIGCATNIVKIINS